MIESLSIRGFRCFDELNVAGIARLNLIIGTNNSGKSSLLEAVSTLVTQGDGQTLYQSMSRRRELLKSSILQSQGTSQFDLDIRRLFFGHMLREGTYFELVSHGIDNERRLVFRIELNLPTGGNNVLPDTNFGQLFLHIPFGDASHSAYRLSTEGGVNPSWIVPLRSAAERHPHIELVSIDAATIELLAEGWGELALTPGEAQVINALRLLEPTLERLAYVQDHRSVSPSFRAKLREFETPIPLGSMGDGMWRILSLIISLVRCKNGILLVDEIDTGLHHSVMADVWRVILETAEKLNVQVFATTHSWDCVKGFASICCNKEGGKDKLAMHRLERGNKNSVHYSERQIQIAVERGIETR